MEAWKTGLERSENIRMKFNFVEFFCGFGSVTESFRKRGFKTWKTDIRKRKDVCEPDLRINIMQLRARDIPFKRVHALWASPPCDVWSYAAGSFHWNKVTKPTNIFTNAKDIKFKELAAFGRGAKIKHKFSNISKNKISKIPEELADEISAYCLKKCSQDIKN